MQNYSFLEMFLIISGLGIAIAIPFTLLWLWILKRGWASVRLLALWSGLLTFTAGATLWLLVRETWLINGTLVFTLIASLTVLTWPITARRIVKKLNLKW